MKLFEQSFTATVAILTLVTPLHAQDYGNFENYTLRVKLIGGAQYEPLYTLIPEWEAATGARVDILSRKSHFELDREMKQDIAAGGVEYCVFSSHTNFAPQYAAMNQPLDGLVGQDVIAAFSPLVIDHATVDGKLVSLPRHSDVSNLFYVRSLYEDADNKARFKAQYGYDLMPPETWNQASDQAIFFADPPNRYGTHFAGKDEAITGRFYEMLVANGGKLFNDDWTAAFNGPEGQEALNWFTGLYQEKAVPAGTPNYVWDDLGLGFAAGNVAFDLDWAGWAGFFNSKDSNIRNDIGVVLAPKGSGGKRTGWSGSHSFSITQNCENKEAAASFITFLTSHEAQMIEARTGLLPTRTQVWDDIIAEFKDQDNDFMVEVFEVWGESMRDHAFTPPLIAEWGEVSNALWPQLQAAIVGDKSVEDALNDAAKEVNEIMEDAGYN
ncbi:carbohydrate ABC transporter substrate-binding protein (CUT1 family) [Rhodovulum imhoffii]|uniref:Carbohydrate ABC transporter substrate-binding protein (CUT1 family) n=1 Tax=Rhodovulum imhoffii TaxID=365340 RepID=A0A2T5BSD1_9RHOB|nr:sugar ABC transporter substrate-binding protein [Rhodovulum imhoffii]MBK5933510.1 sugar ABC transporter substrate-binding protein [Rhodovulum imhoffii]PTN02254.1 carbohydrate ABC transporter substrate-binding protein (CUT1 family) [Rhodovulum imhoffii]